MGEIDFLALDDVLAIHRDQIERYGGSTEIRDLDLLKSALAVLQATFEGSYLHKNIYEMAAAYLFHITQNHPFVDGNKRTGVVAAIVFLALNGIELNVVEEELESMVWKVAEGKLDKDAVAAFIEQNCCI